MDREKTTDSSAPWIAPHVKDDSEVVELASDDAGARGLTLLDIVAARESAEAKEDTGVVKQIDQIVKDSLLED